MSPMYEPPPLRPGARVALLAASGPARPGTLGCVLASIDSLGLQVKIYPSASARYGYLAGPDTLRARDLCDAFADPEIDGILCLRGGYGAARLLPLIDWECVAQNPKPLFGYSDVTALHIALNNLGRVSYHTPMPATEWYKGLDDYTLDWLRAMLFGRHRLRYRNPEGEQPVCLAHGRARGPLCGGNLSLAAASLGTPWEIDTAGKILFLEEIGEAPYRVDGLLTALRNSGKLAACAGLVLGSFTGCRAEPPEDSLSLAQVFDDLLAPLGVPVLANLACGHRLPTLSLPLGREVLLDAGRLLLQDAPAR